MKAQPHLIADISGHGFGHVAMTAPVLNRIGELRPDVCITVRSSAPERLLREHMGVDFEWVASDLDFGMVMRNALEIDVEASLSRYRALHDGWHAEVDAAANQLAALAPTLLLANVPYLSLAAAARARVPAAAMCCLNWAEIFAHYCGDRPGSGAIIDQMLSAYGSASVFMSPEPAMPMPGLQNVRSIGPIGRRGQNLGAAIRRQLDLDPATHLVLLSLGGVPFRIDVSRWPRLEGLHVIAAMDVDGGHPDVTPAPQLGMQHIDLLASGAAAITKPGYGTVVEAAVNGVPVLYVRRDGWPEEPHLVRWLERHGRCEDLPLPSLAEGRFAEAVWRIIERQAPRPPQPTGVEEAARLVLERL